MRPTFRRFALSCRAAGCFCCDLSCQLGLCRCDCRRRTRQHLGIVAGWPRPAGNSRATPKLGNVASELSYLPRSTDQSLSGCPGLPLHKGMNGKAGAVRRQTGTEVAVARASAAGSLAGNPRFSDRRRFGLANLCRSCCPLQLPARQQGSAGCAEAKLPKDEIIQGSNSKISRAARQATQQLLASRAPSGCSGRPSCRSSGPLLHRTTGPAATFVPC